MSDQDSEFINQFDQPESHRRSTRVLRLLRSGDPAVFQNPELQQEFIRLFNLLERIEEIAAREFTPSQREPEPAESPDDHSSREDWTARQTGAGPTADEDEHQEHWWVNFNGDVSLERLARLRKVLSDSPFTIEARFDEIAEGLIVLRIVMERNLTAEQVDWLVRQVMGLVGLDRNAAILSRN